MSLRTSEVKLAVCKALTHVGAKKFGKNRSTEVTKMFTRLRKVVLCTRDRVGREKCWGLEVRLKVCWLEIIVKRFGEARHFSLGYESTQNVISKTKKIVYLCMGAYSFFWGFDLRVIKSQIIGHVWREILFLNNISIQGSTYFAKEKRSSWRPSQIIEISME